MVNSNFFKNSQRYLQVKVHNWYNQHWFFATGTARAVDIGGKFATSVNDTGGKFAAGINDTGGKCQIAAGINDTGGFNCRYWYDTQGLGGNWFMKKPEVKISWHCPLTLCAIILRDGLMKPHYII